MGIKRGVSLYSYQQSDYFHKMTWKDELREVATSLSGADGIEIISEATVPQYPFPSESFYYDWNNEIARWNLKAVTMDTYLDTLQFRDHVMTHKEAAEHLKMDLRIAKKMGFRNMRLVHNVPLDVVEMALPLAEELDVRMTNEIHAPASIKPVFGRDWGLTAANDVAFIQRTGTKHYGLQPDMGIFQSLPSAVQVAYLLRQGMSAAKAASLTDALIGKFAELGKAEFDKYMAKDYPSIFSLRYYSYLFGGSSAQPEDLYAIAPYIYCIHGKFYHMSEIKGQPGHYEEASIEYGKVFEVLKGIGYDGYINSEFEGQRSQQDLGDAGLVNEIEEVRRHHEMMQRLIDQKMFRSM
jgi:hypothetical protein